MTIALGAVARWTRRYVLPLVALATVGFGALGVLGLVVGAATEGQPLFLLGAGWLACVVKFAIDWINAPPDNSP